jgi:hypothetical protein
MVFWQLEMPLQVHENVPVGQAEATWTPTKASRTRMNRMGALLLMKTLLVPKKPIGMIRHGSKV